MLTRVLLAIYRKQIDEHRVDDRLRRFFAEQAEQLIWCNPDPVAALKAFLGPQKRGAPKRNAMRDFDLAADIEEMHGQGMDYNDAYLELFGRLHGTPGELDDRTIKNIHLRETRHPLDKAAVQAWVETRKLDGGESLQFDRHCCFRRSSFPAVYRHLFRTNGCPNVDSFMRPWARSNTRPRALLTTGSPADSWCESRNLVSADRGRAA